MTRKNKFLSRLLTVTVGLLAGFLLAELLAHAYFLKEHGTVFYKLPVPRDDSEAPDEGASGTDNLVIHPYWGRVSKSGQSVEEAFPRELLDKMMTEGSDLPAWIGIRRNNHGFFSRYDYPRLRQADEFVVGIFGGSVASLLSLFGAEQIAAGLAKHPYFEGRRVVVLNFANGGVKQPQQLMILNYFLLVGQPFDVVVNLDGFNEAVLATSNRRHGIDIVQPFRFQQRMATLLRDPETAVVKWQAEVVSAREALDALKRMDRQRWSATLHLALRELQKSYATRLVELEEMFPDAPETERGPARAPSPETVRKDQGVDAIVDLWIRASAMMEQAAHLNSIDYVHVLQPNQYLSERAFSDEERQIALNARSRTGETVRDIYPSMLDALAEHKRNGHAVFSALDILDAESRRVYADNCCHFTDAGNSILAAFVAQKILETMNLQDRR